MLEDNDKEWIISQIKANTQYSQRILGDTPTDANQLTPKKYVTKYVLYGAVSGPNGTYLPDGWTATSVGLGLMNVNHTLGTTDFGVLATPYTTGFDRSFTILVSALTATVFQINTVNAATGLNADVGFFFVTIKQP